MIKLFVIENEYTEADKRAYERKNVDFSWLVYGAENGVLAGEVADIGEQGFRLIGDVPIEMGESFPFRMEISLESGEQPNPCSQSTLFHTRTSKNIIERR